MSSDHEALKQASERLESLERELRRTREELYRLMALVDRGPATVFLWRIAPRWPVEYVSANISRFGYDPEEFRSGRISWAELIHPDDTPRLDAEITRAIQDGTHGLVLEYRIITRSGEVRWVEEHALGLLDEHHRLTHYQGIILDITARKRAEAALLAGKEELESRVAERTADLTRANEKLRREIAQRQRAMEALQLDETRLEALLDLNLMTEASVKEITHFAMEEAVRLTRSTLGYLAFVNESETVMTMHAWSERAMYDCLIAEKPLIYPVETTGLWGEAVRQRRPIITNDYQAPNPWKKGYPEGHVELHRHMNVPIMEGGRVVAVIGVANKETEYDDADVRQLRLLGTGMWRILERKRVVDALKENEERYRSLFAVEPDALVLLDAQTGQILEANDSACQLFGYELEEFLSLTALDISAEPEKTRAVMDGWQPGRTDKVPYRNSLRKDGTIFPTEIAIRHFELQGRRLLYAAYRDITARVRAEAEMEEAHERLLRAEIEKKQFYRQVIRAVTHNKLHLVDLAQIPLEGDLVLEASFDEPESYRALRQRVQQAAIRAGMPEENAADLMLAVSEAVANAIKHAKDGRCALYVTPERVIARVSDRGTGIHPENLPATILTPGFSTKVSLGMGYTLMLEVADEMWLTTGPTGTIVQLAKWIHPERHVKQPDLLAWNEL